MISLLRLCRLYYSVPMSLAYLLTVYYARGGRMGGAWIGAGVSTAALALVIAGAYALNDFCDAKTDRINAPHRPIPSGQCRQTHALVWSAFLLISGLALAGLARWQFAVTLTAVATGLVLYDVFSKRLGVAKPLAVAALMTCIYPLSIAQAGWPVGPRAWSLAVFPAWMFLTSFGYEILKDLRDIAGDPHISDMGAPAAAYPHRWRAASTTAISFGATLLVGPAFLGCGWVYMLVALFAMAAALFSAFQPLQKAIRFVYAECVLVGVAATMDVIIGGV